MSIRVTSIQSAPSHYGWATCVVSTIDPGSRVKLSENSPHLILKFADTEDDYNPHAPQMWHVQRMFQWLGDHNITAEDNLLFHCFAGISRSSAMAWSALLSLGVPIEEAFQLTVRGAENSIWPNTLILSHTDAILGMGGALVDFALKKDKEIAAERHFGIYGGL